MDLREQGVMVLKSDAVGLHEGGDQLVVDLDAAGFDELDPGLRPCKCVGDLLASHADLTAEGSEAVAEVAAGGVPTGERAVRRVRRVLEGPRKPP